LFPSADSIVSNQVLEHEHQAILAQIQQCTLQKQPIPDELQDKKNGYEIRMNMLVTMVQLGQLTMQGLKLFFTCEFVFIPGDRVHCAS
jgi:hypothetical protein